MAGDPLERPRLDDGQTIELLRALTDVRFELLAFVPTIAGTAIGLLARAPSAGALMGVGAVGMVATLGIVAYELRNTQVSD
jgi:hypothetical protein